MSEEWGPWIESLKRAVIYFHSTGSFVWVAKPDVSQENRRWNARYAGRSAFNSVTKRGYLAGRFQGKAVLAHRLVWAFEVGQFPDAGIDHINGCKTDNRFINLRAAPQSVNNKNASLRSDNTSGCAGVVRSGKNWVARINVDGSRMHLGTFQDVESAIKARLAEQSRHAFSERHGQ